MSWLVGCAVAGGVWRMVIVCHVTSGNVAPASHVRKGDGRGGSVLTWNHDDSDQWHTLSLSGWLGTSTDVPGHQYFTVPPPPFLQESTGMGLESTRMELESKFCKVEMVDDLLFPICAMCSAPQRGAVCLNFWPIICMMTYFCMIEKIQCSKCKAIHYCNKVLCSICNETLLGLT